MEKVIIEKDKAHTQKHEEVISAETKISHLKTSIERLESENCDLKVCIEKQAKEIATLQNASQHENVTELELRLYKVLYLEEMDRCKALEEKLKGYSERLAESYKVLLTKSQQIRLTSPKNEKGSPVTYAFSDLPSLLLNLDGTQASQTNKDISETSTLLPANDSLSVNNLIDWHNKQMELKKYKDLYSEEVKRSKLLEDKINGYDTKLSEACKIQLTKQELANNNECATSGGTIGSSSYSCITSKFGGTQAHQKWMQNFERRPELPDNGVLSFNNYIESYNKQMRQRMKRLSKELSHAFTKLDYFP
ncbi:uncharacterized protein LOC120529604 [Polypterus senegalus]|uniref:uncharacterized protein LOC120529604 n=1 Tax=Polypterus senegalus TaxID=55291 RepID=UPI001964A082|nr:uncharacterized protein LOC120529604 [Polypterus senegalus]